jgi:O-antigen/teichoic acid export membrane protein
MYLKKAIRGSIIVITMTVFASVFSYLFRILLAREFSVAEYGLFYSVFTFFSFFTIFIDLGLNQSVAKYAIQYKVKKKLAAVKSILVYSLTFQIALSLIIFLVIATYAVLSPQNLFGQNNTMSVILMGIWFVTLPIPTFLVNMFSTFQKYPLSNSLELFRQFVSLMFSLLFIYLNFGVRSPFLAYACLNLLMLVTYLPVISKIFPDFYKLKVTPQKDVLLEIIKYGLYISLANLMFTIMTQTDTLMLAFFKGTETVGFYQVALPIAGLVAFVGTSIVAIAFPIIAELNSTKKIEQLKEGTAIVFKFLTIFSLPIVVILFSFASFPIIFLFGEKYLSAAPIVQILVFSVFFGLLTSVNTTILTATGFAKKTAWAMAIAAAMNIVLNLLLIPKFSTLGAASATLISSATGFILSCIIVSKNIKFKFNISSLIKSAIAALAMATTIYLLRPTLSSLNIYWMIIISLLIAGLVYTVILFATRAITIKEIKEFVRVTVSK